MRTYWNDDFEKPGELIDKLVEFIERAEKAFGENDSLDANSVKKGEKLTGMIQATEQATEQTCMKKRAEFLKTKFLVSL